VPRSGSKVVEIGAAPQSKQELFEPPPIPVLRLIWRRRPEIRRILLKANEDDIRSAFEWLYKERTKEEKRLGNPFAAVKLSFSEKGGLIDGAVTKTNPINAVIVGTASSAAPQVLGFRFGSFSIPVKFGLTTACGIVQNYVNGSVKGEVRELREPKAKSSPDSVDTTDYDKEFPGMNKLVKERFHYQLDHEIFDWALEVLRTRRHYKLDIESFDEADNLRSAGLQLVLLKSGSLTPQEQSPFDFIDPVKGSYLQGTFNQYTLLRNRLKDRGNSVAFGVLRYTEPRRAVIREIIDRILEQELPDWIPGRMKSLDDNDVLGLLLDRGEYTAIIKKTPHEDILQIEGLRERARHYLGGPRFSQYEADIQESKTYQFFMGFGNGRALRFDYPVFRDSQQEGVTIRDTAAPIIYALSAPVDEDFGGDLPRVLTFAQERSEKHLDALAEQLPTWVGGRRK
jgi:hypothetical protein